MIWGVDWGAYLSSVKGPAIPFQDLHDAGLLDFFVTKGCQEADYYSSVKNIQWAREAGVKCVGSYYWHYPTWTPEYQVAVYSDAIRAEKPDFIALDMEDSQGCSDWQVTTNAEAVCAGLAANFPNLKLYIYTSADYINGHCPTFNRSIGKYGRWIACWPGVIRTGMDRYLSAEGIKAYPLAGWKAKLPTGWDGWDIWQDNNWAIPEGYGWPYNHQYDWNVSNLTVEQLIGKEEKPVTETRAHFVIVSDEDKNIDIASICENADNIALTMVSQLVDGMIVHKDTGFQTWVDRATKPAVGVVVMDQDLFWKKEIDLDDFQTRTMWKNETIRALIEQWRSVPIPAAEWDAQHLNITASSGWHDIRALWLMMSTTINPKHGEKIAGSWQYAIVEDLLKVLTPLMAGGYIPKIPIFIVAPSKWYQEYANDPGWTIKARIEDKQIAGLGVMRTWGSGSDGVLITDVAPMAVIADSIADFWQYDPVGYVQPFKLDYADYKFFVWSFNRLLAADMFYPGAAVTPATVGSWMATPEEVAALLGAQVVEPPPQPPTEETVTIQRAEYDGLLAKAATLAKIEAILAE